jgi:hypothetical protein
MVLLGIALFYAILISVIARLALAVGQILQQSGTGAPDPSRLTRRRR